MIIKVAKRISSFYISVISFNYNFSHPDFLFVFQIHPYKKLILAVKPNVEGEEEDLLVWITEPGEEYFMHMSQWRDVPFTFKLDKSLKTSDLTLKKVEKIKTDGCNSDENYD